MQLILVSACLAGEAVRYDGSQQRPASAILDRWLAEGRVVAVCPELAGGLAVPRPPAEIAGVGGGDSVLEGSARVVDAQGGDMTAAFVRGARSIVELAQEQRIRLAVLKESSPSCGSRTIHDGSFGGRKIPGRGVAAACLERAGVRVFGEGQLAEADALLRHLETAAD